MQKNYTEKDWRLFRKLIPEWQEHFIDKLNKEYIEILSKNDTPSTIFWNLHNKIKEDKKNQGVLIEMKRSTMIENIVSLINNEVISFDELKDFSDLFKETVKLYLNI